MKIFIVLLCSLNTLFFTVLSAQNNGTQGWRLTGIQVGSTITGPPGKYLSSSEPARDLLRLAYDNGLITEDEYFENESSEYLGRAKLGSEWNFGVRSVWAKTNSPQFRIGAGFRYSSLLESGLVGVFNDSSSLALLAETDFLTFETDAQYQIHIPEHRILFRISLGLFYGQSLTNRIKANEFYSLPIYYDPCEFNCPSRILSPTSSTKLTGANQHRLGAWAAFTAPILIGRIEIAPEFRYNLIKQTHFVNEWATAHYLEIGLRLGYNLK